MVNASEICNLLLIGSSARRGWFYNNLLQLSVIGLSLVIPVLETSKLNTNLFNWDIPLVSVIGIMVAALTAANRQFGFEEKWRHYRMAAEMMRNEGDDFFALAGRYEQFDSHEKAFAQFIKTVTTSKRAETNSYVEMDNKEKKQKKSM